MSSPTRSASASTCGGKTGSWRARRCITSPSTCSRGSRATTSGSRQETDAADRGFQAFHTARRTIQGFEAMLWLRKGFGFAGAWTVREQNRLLDARRARLGAAQAHRAHQPDQRSSDFIALLEEVDRRYGPKLGVARSKDATPSPPRSSHFHPWWCTPRVLLGCLAHAHQRCPEAQILIRSPIQQEPSRRTAPSRSRQPAGLLRSASPRSGVASSRTTASVEPPPCW